MNAGTVKGSSHIFPLFVSVFESRVCGVTPHQQCRYQITVLLDMAAFMIEVSHGCVVTWKHSSNTTTITDLWKLMKEQPHNFKGDVAVMDFPVSTEGDILEESCTIASSSP